MADKPESQKGKHGFPFLRFISHESTTYHASQRAVAADTVRITAHLSAFPQSPGVIPDTTHRYTLSSMT